MQLHFNSQLSQLIDDQEFEKEPLLRLLFVKVYFPKIKSILKYTDCKIQCIQCHSGGQRKLVCHQNHTSTGTDVNIGDIVILAA